MYSFFSILIALSVYLPSGKRDVNLETIIKNNIAGKATLGYSQKGCVIEAWYFPGTSDKRAIVIGGVHGSELSSIAVANELIDQLRQKQGYYSVIVIPCLFPDNAEAAKNDFAGIGTINNTGRYTHNNAPDPNRQMPSPGKAYKPHSPKDHLGREIERENQLLLDLIDEFRPDRIANLHAIRDEAQAGIYADPRTDSKGFALGFAADSALAINMAAHVYEQGGEVPGNKINKRPSALYYKDPAVAQPGQLQKRNACGSTLPSNRGHGISLGTWASTAVQDDEFPAANRDAITLITIEFPGYKAPKHYATVAQQQQCSRQVQLYASSVLHVFLVTKQ
jgi:hypothetical protein